LEAQQASSQKHKQRRNQALAFYRRIGSTGWDKSGYFTDIRKFPLLRNWISKRLPVYRGSVLSLGCGTGELERFLTQEGHRVVGLDLTLEMLRRASRRGSGGLVQADAHALPFRAAAFDAVVLPESIGHLELGRAIPEMNRVLKIRGWLLLTTYSAHRSVHRSYARYSHEQISIQLDKAGFGVKDLRFLKSTRRAVKEVASDAQSDLVFLLARIRS
jgi:ubiquinone/menaquinone biosynthesis C-methylase UbiE